MVPPLIRLNGRADGVSFCCISCSRACLPASEKNNLTFMFPLISPSIAQWPSIHKLLMILMLAQQCLARIQNAPPPPPRRLTLDRSMIPCIFRNTELAY